MIRDGDTRVLQPIGTIRTAFSRKEDAPAQGALRPEGVGTIEVLPEYIDALDSVDTFSHLILLYALDRPESVQMRPVPLLGDSPTGLFATRHPARPNGIGLTVVSLLAREGATLTVGMVDMLDQTPLLDIKPYVPTFDAFPEASEGWFAGCRDRAATPGRA